MKSVYLAGPISGLTFNGATEWRKLVRARLENAVPGIQVYSPLRGKEFLENSGIIEGSYSDELATSRAINTRDHNDCRTADLIFCNLLGTGSRVSIGTVMEIAWAFAYRVPLVMVMEQTGNIHDHPMIQECYGWRTDNLDKATDIATLVLRP